MPQSSKYDIYLSYSRQDREYADQLYKALSKFGCKVFYDFSDLTTAANFANSLFDAILDSKVFVVIYSESTSNSTWIKREVEFASQEEKRIFPILIDNVVLDSHLKYALYQYQFLRIDSNNISYQETNIKTVFKVLFFE